MPTKVDLVLQGYAALSDTERAEFVRRVNELIDASEPRKKTLIEDLRKSTRLTMGPVGGGCPCCGR